MSPRIQTAIFVITLSLMTLFTYWMVTYHLNIWLSLNILIIVGGAAATHWSLTKAQREMDEAFSKTVDNALNDLDNFCEERYAGEIGEKLIENGFYTSDLTNNHNAHELHDAHVDDYNWHYAEPISYSDDIPF